MKSRPKFYRFAYYVDQVGHMKLRHHQLRDADAAAELAPVLYAKGYEYGGIIYNYPAPKSDKEGLRKKRHKIRPIDMGFLSPDDVLVFTTRPPLDDDRAKRKEISRSYTSLEALAFKTLRCCFKTSSRPLMELTKRIADKLPDGFRDRASIDFREHTSAYQRLKEYRGLVSHNPPHPPRTAFYIVHPPKLALRDPHILCVFAIAGTETLIWSHLIRTRYRNKISLDKPRIVIAESKIHKIPKKPNDLSFADEWDVEFILDMPL